MENYGKEVVGRRVEVQFKLRYDDNNTTTAFFPGTVTKYIVSLRSDTSTDQTSSLLKEEHIVEFDDGDRRSIESLLNSEQKGLIRWLSSPTTASSQIPTKKEEEVDQSRAPPSSATALPEVPLKGNAGGAEDPTIVSRSTTTSSSVQEGGRSRKKSTGKAGTDTEISHEESPRSRKRSKRNNSSYDDGENFGGLSGTFEEDTSSPMADAEEDEEREEELPKTIADILRYMDRTEPGNGYHLLGPIDTRANLRKFAKKYPTHPGVEHYVTNVEAGVEATKCWGPPTRAALSELVELIKDMYPEPDDDPSLLLSSTDEDDFQMPKSIDDIIRYMARQEPDQNYHLVGPMDIRSKLRPFAEANEDHPAVRHYVHNKAAEDVKLSERWTPPNRQTLNALMELIKTMLPAR